jgi:hydrogenase nickel incorporation protein HypA/HybF
MHELAICESILAQAVAIATAHQAGRVKRITLRIGPLAGVEPGLLSAAFPLVAAGTCCEAARLCIESVAVRVECQLCGAVSQVRPNRLLCGVCGTWRVALLSGDDMRLESLEVFGETSETEREIDHV